MLKSQLIPDQMGSYSNDDAIFLLRDISHAVKETKTEERESLIQSGVHYSEMLPVEYHPPEEYINLFHDTLKKYSKRIAVAIGVVAEQIIERKNVENLVLVSLARAGTPIGVLIKRYIQDKYKIAVPHYSISIIRGRGIDEKAIDFIFEHHPSAEIQVIDGWTGKGAITSELAEACKQYNTTHTNYIDDSLAVLADPGHCVDIYGTRDDFLIPSACLNLTVSGLVSRTVLNYEFMQEDDFHGAKYYKELADADLSNYYVDTISSNFREVEEPVAQELEQINREDKTPTWLGLKSIERIKSLYNIRNTHFIKPGVGETTRVLLRRIPWKILINPDHSNDLSHILFLAKERNVPIEEFRDMSYTCCGIIKEV